MKKVFLLVLLAGIFLAGCVVEEETTAPVGEGKCSVDEDCQLAGCSGQVCAAKGSDVVTTCEWKDKYECYTLTSCGCVEGSCAWEENTEFAECLAKY